MWPTKIQINGIDFSEHVSEMKIVQYVEPYANEELEDYVSLKTAWQEMQAMHYEMTAIQDEILLFKPSPSLREMRDKRHPLAKPNGWKELCRR